MSEKNFVKNIFVQLLLVCMVSCYVLTSFQSKIFVVFHDLSHELVPAERFDSMDHHVLSLESSKANHKHSLANLHKHKTLSFIKIIINFDKSDPYAKDKNEFKVDKHVFTHSSSNFQVHLKQIEHKYVYTVQSIYPPFVKIKGPPPRFSIT